MNTKTTNLNFNLPVNNSTGWGEDINNNFTAVDNAFAQLEAQMNTVSNQLGGIGLYAADKVYKVLGFTVDGNNIVTTITAKPSETSLGQELTIYENGNFTKDFDRFAPYTYFLVNIPNFTKDKNIEFNNIKWSDNDIAVKLVDFNNNNIPRLDKFAQTVGGYYQLTGFGKPDKDSNTVVAKYKRVNSVTAEDNIETPYIYPRIIDAAGNNLTYELYQGNGAADTSGDVALGVRYDYNFPVQWSQTNKSTITLTESDINKKTYTYHTGIRTTTKAGGMILNDAKVAISQVEFQYNNEYIILAYTIDDSTDEYTLNIDISKLSANNNLTISCTYGVDQILEMKGEDGKNGVNGVNGITPNIGDNGNWFIGDIDTKVPAEGIPGIQGERGYKGDKGDKGDQGDQGPQGPKGCAGERGAQGPEGPKGDAGPQGPKGDKGDKGEDGTFVTINGEVQTTWDADTKQDVISEREYASLFGL